MHSVPRVDLKALDLVLIKHLTSCSDGADIRISFRQRNINFILESGLSTWTLRDLILAYYSADFRFTPGIKRERIWINILRKTHIKATCSTCGESQYVGLKTMKEARKFFNLNEELLLSCFDCRPCPICLEKIRDRFTRAFAHALNGHR